ncbi:MAG: ABC transporter substrate-binding protein [Alkalilacustris sp.]
MSVWRAVSEALPALGLALGLGGAALAGPPERVVSINLCTDQLAMLLAAEGQLLSVSRLARDPRSSAMAEEAAAWPVNSGRAEEVYLQAPDLVLAGSFTTPATVEMLRRLGIGVVLFPPAQSLADVGAQLRRMGDVLGRPAQGAALADRFEATLQTLAQEASAARAALFQANGWSAGRHSLPGEVLAAAGFANVAAELGMDSGGFLPLEALVMAAPDLVVTGRPFPGASRAEELTGHPALLATAPAGVALTDRDWVCGLPHVLNAVEAMLEARQSLGTGP